MRYLFVLLLLLITPVYAQQQAAATPSEVALQINNIIGQWAQTLVQQSKTIEDLQKQLSEEKLKSKGLEDKLKESK